MDDFNFLNDAINEGEKKFICLENVHKTYLLGIEGIAALRGVDVDIKEGEFVMVCGTSGGGKSTMLNIMGTIDKPTKGRVTLCGKLITPRTSDDELAQIRLENLGFVFQTFNLLSSMTALENVELPLTFLGVGSSKRKQIAKELLETVQMGDRLNHFPNMLSGGEQQRVTIARAMANKPGLLLLDEPTGDLDTLNTNNVMRLLVDLNKKGITLVMVTHDMNLIGFASRIIFMRDGKISATRVNKQEEREKRMAELEEQIRLGRDGSRSFGVLPALGRFHSSSTPVSDRIIPVCTSVRDPGNYETVHFSDKRAPVDGYEIVIDPATFEVTKAPLTENPYSTLCFKPEKESNKKEDSNASPPPLNRDDDKMPLSGGEGRVVSPGKSRVSHPPFLSGEGGGPKTHASQSPTLVIDGERGGIGGNTNTKEGVDDDVPVIDTSFFSGENSDSSSSSSGKKRRPKKKLKAPGTHPKRAALKKKD